MTTALLIALVYWGLYVLDESFSWQALVRPIVAGPVVGLVLGDFQTGIIMGGMIEAVYMGVVSIGGGAPANAYDATIICTSFVITSGLSMEAGLALALPIGTLTARIPQLLLPIHAYFIKVFEKYAANGDWKSYARLQQAYRFVVSRTIQSVIVFFAIWLGADAVTAVFEMLPGFVLSGLTVAANMLPAVGLGILATMIFNKEMGAFLFIGFAMNAYLGLNTMATAIFAGAVAVFYFFNDIGKNNQTVTIGKELDEEEEFLS